MAAGVEVLLLGAFGLWLWSSRPSARPQVLPRPTPVHWLAHRPKISREHPVGPVIQRAESVVHPPRLRISGGSLLARAVGVPVPQVGTLRLSGIHAAQGAGFGSPGRGIAVRFLIPGSGGFPATTDRVKELHRGWCGREFGPVNSYVWLVGRVGRSGRVVSVTVLRTDSNKSMIQKSVESVRGDRFSPLRRDGHPTWFRIVEVYWWESIVDRSRDPSWWVYCRTLERNHQMPSWLLYHIHGHHPLAARLTYGPLAKDQPTPDIARAVALTLRLLVAGDLPR